MVAHQCHACGSLLAPPDGHPWLCKYCGAPQETVELEDGYILLNDTSIVSFLRPLLTGADSAYVHPSIPEKKLAGARKVHAANIPPQETILALYDGTAFGSATDGFVLTSRRIAWKNQMEDPRFLDWTHVDEDEVYSDDTNLVIGRAKLDTLYSDDDDELETWVEAIQTLARSARPAKPKSKQSSGGGGAKQAAWGGPEVAVAAGGWGGMQGGFSAHPSSQQPDVERLPRAPYSVDTGCSLVDVHPSGEIVLASGSNRIELRHAANGQRVRAFDAPDSVLSARFSPDGNWILVGTLDGRAHLYDARSGAARGAMPKMDDGVDEVAWLGRSTFFVAGGQRGEVWIVDATNMQPTNKILGPDADYESLGGIAVTPDGSRLYVSMGSRLGAFDTASGKILWRHDEALQNSSRLTVSPRGDWLIAAGYDGVAVFNAASGQSGPRMNFQCARNVTWPEGSGGFLRRKKDEDDMMWSWSPRPKFSPLGDLVATQDQVGNLCLLDIASGVLHPTPRDHGRAWIEDLAWFNDGNHLLLGMSDNSIAIWRVRPLGGVMRSEAIGG